MKKISTGQPSNLATYRDIAIAFVGTKNHKAVKYFDNLINHEPKGEEGEIITDESQMLLLITQLAFDSSVKDI